MSHGGARRDRRTATARSAFVVLQATDAVPLQPIVTGCYRDRFARTVDGWAFTERSIAVDHVGETGDHLTLPLL